MNEALLKAVIYLLKQQVSGEAEELLSSLEVATNCVICEIGVVHAKGMCNKCYQNERRKDRSVARRIKTSGPQSLEDLIGIKKLWEID